MEHTEYVQVVSEEWRTDGGQGWVTPVVLVTGASPEFRRELLSRPERRGRHDPSTDIIRFEKFSHMDVRIFISMIRILARRSCHIRQMGNFQVINFLSRRGFFLMHDGLPRSAQIRGKGEDKWVFVYMVKRDRKRRDTYGE